MSGSGKVERRGGLPSLFLLTGPFLLSWSVFWLVPICSGISLAMEMSPHISFAHFSDADGLTLKNFRLVLEDSKFLHSLKNTAFFAGGSVLITLVLGFFLAVVVYGLHPKIRGVCLFLLLIPSFALPGTLASVFYLFFHGKSGALNQFLVIPLGFDPVNWMMDPFWILPCLILQSVWRWTGLIVLLLYCGMRAIPAWQFEVAYIEGASSWSRICTILYPGVRHLIIFGGVFLFIDGVAAFSGAYNLLGGSGGVLDAGLLFVTYVYQVAFPGGGGRFDLPLASAMCVLVAGFSAIFGWMILKFGKQTGGGS